MKRDHLANLSELIGVVEAARLARRSPGTMRAWYARRAVVANFAGRWGVNRIALRFIQDGHCAAIRAFRKGDRLRPEIIAAFTAANDLDQPEGVCRDIFPAAYGDAADVLRLDEDERRVQTDLDRRAAA